MTPTTETAAKKNLVRLPISRLVAKIAMALGMITALIVLLLFLAGVFQPKVPADKEAPAPILSPNAIVAEVRLVRRPQVEAAVGTVRAVHEAAVASKILARVTSINVKAGQAVSREQILASLDDSDLQARLKQAKAALAGSLATRDEATQQFQRAEQLRETNAIAAADYERAKAALLTSTAAVERAEQLVREAKVLLDFATIRAPITGIVIDKRVEAGDTVTPGQVLLTLYDPTRMQLVATVRESLALRLKVGQTIAGRLEALGHDCKATVSEIVPESQAASRSFTVKVTGPCPAGVYSGMFGRIFIPLEDEQIVVVPAAAVFRVGQLDMVRVVENEQLQRRSIQVGRRLDDDYEVLAGLKPGEKVVLEKRETSP
jgi:membrane fusion protein (multidrug efflux system)